MTPAEIFHRLLEESAATIAHPGAHALPADELHTEILLPLLPAMLRDPVIRDAWLNPIGRGFFFKMKVARETSDAMPLWIPDDFEIHVTASYLAGPDAKALADTLLSEPSLRDLTAALMNQILDIVWQILPPVEPAATESLEIAPPKSVAAVLPDETPLAPTSPATPTWRQIAQIAKSAHLRIPGSPAPIYLRILRAFRGQTQFAPRRQNPPRPRIFPSQRRW